MKFKKVITGYFMVFLLAMMIFSIQSIDSATEVKASTDSQSIDVLEEQTNEWNAHEFEIIDDTDVSFGKIRLRRKIEILAPSALTRRDRIATLIAAGQQIWSEYKVDAMTLFLLAFESGPAIAGIDYAPDKCGWTGNDCTDHVWTEAFATDVVFIPKEQGIIVSWETYREEFMELDEDFGFEVLNESRLKEFLAKRFNTNVDEIYQAKLKEITTISSQQKMTIPDHFERSSNLNVQKQEESGETDIEKEIQKYAIEPCILIMSRALSLDEDFSDEEILEFMSRMIKTHMEDTTQSIMTIVGNIDDFDDRLFVYNYFNNECSEITFDIE